MRAFYSGMDSATSAGVLTATLAAPNPRLAAPPSRPTSWWLATLRKRAEKMYAEKLDLSEPVVFESEEERKACLKFFNAAYRAEESGLAGAHRLAGEVRPWDPDLAECLVLYGNEEGWHRELLTEFLRHLGGGVQPMGRMTGSFYKAYGRAKRMNTVLLTNLMFETIGATTYRLALRRVRQPQVRQILKILTRDESFHVPLNVHFIREVLRREPATGTRLKTIYQMVFHSLVLMSFGSRKVARDFDRIGWHELTKAYIENLAALFQRENDLDLRPPKLLLAAFGVKSESLRESDGARATSIDAAEAAADRDNVVVTAL